MLKSWQLLVDIFIIEVSFLYQFNLLEFIWQTALMIPSLTLCAMQGIITAPILYAIEEFPQLRSVVDKGFDEFSNVDVVSEPFYRCN